MGIVCQIIQVQNQACVIFLFLFFSLCVYTCTHTMVFDVVCIFVLPLMQEYCSLGQWSMCLSVLQCSCVQGTERVVGVSQKVYVGASTSCMFVAGWS